MDRVTVSPGGLVTAALQREVSMLADRPKEALVPYCSEGRGPACNIEYGKSPGTVFGKKPGNLSQTISPLEWKLIFTHFPNAA